MNAEVDGDVYCSPIGLRRVPAEEQHARDDTRRARADVGPRRARARDARPRTARAPAPRRESDQRGTRTASMSSSASCDERERDAEEQRREHERALRGEPRGEVTHAVFRASGGQPGQRLVIGRRRSLPNAFGDTRTPGGGLPALVLVAVDQPRHAPHRLHVVAVGLELADRLVVLHVALDDRIEHAVRSGSESVSSWSGRSSALGGFSITAFGMTVTSVALVAVERTARTRASSGRP